MCFPENDLPASILRVELGSNDIADIAAIAYTKFDKKWEKIIRELTKNRYRNFCINEHDWKKIKSITDPKAGSNIYCYKMGLSKTISEIYPVIIKAEDYIKHIDDYACIN